MTYKKIDDAVRYLQEQGVDRPSIIDAFGKAQSEYYDKITHKHSRSVEEEYISRRILELLDPHRE